MTDNYYIGRLPTEASPTKLKNGSWGARVKSDSVKEGDPLKVTTKSGKSWTTYVSRVVWAGNGVTIVSTSKTGLGDVEGFVRPSTKGDEFTEFSSATFAADYLGWDVRDMIGYSGWKSSTPADLEEFLLEMLDLEGILVAENPDSIVLRNC
jgi:hypothetical protein